MALGSARAAPHCSTICAQAIPVEWFGYYGFLAAQRVRSAFGGLVGVIRTTKMLKRDGSTRFERQYRSLPRIGVDRLTFASQ